MPVHTHRHTNKPVCVFIPPLCVCGSARRYQSSVGLGFAMGESVGGPSFNQSDWADDEGGGEGKEDGVGLIVTTAATRVSVWDGPWEEEGATASTYGHTGGVSVGELTGGGATHATVGVKATVRTAQVDCPVPSSHRLVPDDAASRHAKAVRCFPFVASRRVRVRWSAAECGPQCVCVCVAHWQGRARMSCSPPNCPVCSPRRYSRSQCLRPNQWGPRSVL